MNDWVKRYAYFRSWQLMIADPPVYHRSRMWDDRVEDGSLITIPAVCGLALTRWDRENGARHYDPVVIRREHADKFARPCERCWPSD